MRKIVDTTWIVATYARIGYHTLVTIANKHARGDRQQARAPGVGAVMKNEPLRAHAAAAS